MEKISLRLSLDEVNLLLQALSQLPYQQVKPQMDTIYAQAQAQIEAQAQTQAQGHAQAQTP